MSMTDNQFEQLLATAIQEYGGDYIEVPEEMYKPHRFTRSFEKRMRQILRKKRGIRPSSKRIPLRMLIAIIVTAIIAGSATALSVSAIREAIWGFITEVYETFTNVRAEQDENVPVMLEEIYEVTWVPEGFVVAKETYTYNTNQIEFENGKEYIILRQTTISNYNVNYDTESVAIEGATNGMSRCFWIVQDESKIFVWEKDNYIFELTISFNGDDETAQKVAIAIAKRVEKVEH